MATNRRRAIRRKIKKAEGSSPVLTGLAAITAAGLGAASAWIVYSHLMVDHAMFLPNAIPAERKSFNSRRAGMLSYYCDRKAQGRPLVLIHSVNAAASAYEMLPIFEQYRAQRPVYALDLPGFGFSSREKRAYSPQLYADAILDFLQSEVGEEADVVALSLGSEFVARAALENPELFHTLALISPTGLGREQSKRASQQAGQSGASQFLYPAFSLPLWSRPFYDLLTTRASIKYFLEKSFLGQVPPDLIEYDFYSAHQPGAEHAPLNFISGKLFTPGVRESIYEQVSTRTLVIYDRDSFTGFDLLPVLLANNLRWVAVRLVPTLGLPQFEQMDSLAETLDRFWEGNIVT